MVRPALATGLAALAAALAVPALARLASGLDTDRLVTRASGYLERALRPLRLAGEEGLVPSDRERLRLQALASGIGLPLGVYLEGALGGVLLAIGGAWLGSRALVWRRQRFRRAVDAGAALAAVALADALSSGHSVRGALALAAADLPGAIGVELRRAVRGLELGATTDSALERMRQRCRSRRIDLICAAVRIQRRSGGALAGLLRGIAATIDEHDRLLDEARAASAQARFTSWIVLALPLLGLLLGEVVAPGLLGTMFGSRAGRWLLATALALQVCGALLVVRLAQVER
jgi:tight adherence protein B